MNLQNILINYDINRKIPTDMVSVIHVNDIHSRVLELALFEGKQPFALSAAHEAHADIVVRSNKQLLKSGLTCEISEEGHILVPVDDLQCRGKMDINVEVTVRDEANHTVLTLPYPIWVRVNPSVLDDAEIPGEATGTIPELLEKVKAELERIEDFVDVEQAYEILDLAFTGDPNICPTLLVDNTIDATYNPNGHYILYYIDSDGGRHNLFDISQYFAEKAAVPSKTSQLTNDSGFLTSHQSLANYYNKTDVNNLLAGKANASHTHSQYLTSADIANKADKSEIPDISGKADKATTYTKSEVDALVSAGVVPQYVIDESESVLAKAFSHTGLGRTVRFIAVSDGHNDATEVSHSYTRIANKHCGQAVKYIAERIPLDFVASLGDMTWAGVAHTTAQYQTDWLKADLQEMNLFLRDGFGGVPNIRVVGNHDQCATTGSGGAVSRLQNSGAYQLIGRYNAGTGDGLSNYGYYDIERAKLRVIYLNTSDTVSTSTQGTLLSVSQAQKNWLCETLIALNEKSDAADWKILLMSHAPLDMNSGIAADILLPYTNGGTYGSYAFTNHSAKIIGNCHGHTHCYNVGYMSDKIRRFTIPNANFYDNNHYKNNESYAAWNEDTTYPKTENSRTDTSFSLVTVDLDSLTCYVDNYGAGYDREFSLDYKSEPAPVNLFDKTDADVVIGGRFSSSRAIVADQQEALVTGYIPATTADVLHVVTNKANNSTAQVGAAQLYDSGKNYIGIYISPKASQNAGISPKPTWAADYLSGDFDLSVTPNSGTNAGVAYIRFCLAYTDIDEIKVYQ